MMQSRDTKNLNLDRDFEEIVSKVEQMKVDESTRTQSFWKQDEDEIEDQQPSVLCAQGA